MRITKHWNNNRVFSLLVISLYFTCNQMVNGCGSYIDIATGGSAVISSPSNYGPYVNCIWNIQTGENYQLELIVNFEGQEAYGICGDYIIVRDGSKTSTDLLSKNCSTLTNFKVTASYRWLWVQFRSDGINVTSGFQGQIQSVVPASPITNVSDPTEGCRSYEISCKNHECVPLSYKCDSFNDCGCDGDDCDENNCEGLPLSSLQQIAMGVSIGFAIFIVIFLVAFAYEYYMKKKRLMADSEAQTALQKEKERGRRRDKKKRKG